MLAEVLITVRGESVGWWSESRLTHTSQSPNSQQQAEKWKCQKHLSLQNIHEIAKWQLSNRCQRRRYGQSRLLHTTTFFFQNRIFHLHFFIPPLPFPLERSASRNPQAWWVSLSSHTRSPHTPTASKLLILLLKSASLFNPSTVKESRRIGESKSRQLTSSLPPIGSLSSGNLTALSNATGSPRCLPLSITAQRITLLALCQPPQKLYAWLGNPVEIPTQPYPDTTSKAILNTL